MQFYELISMRYFVDTFNIFIKCIGFNPQAAVHFQYMKALGKFAFLSEMMKWTFFRNNCSSTVVNERSLVEGLLEQ